MSVGYQCPNYDPKKGADYQDNFCKLHHGPCKREGASHMSMMYSSIRLAKEVKNK